MVLFVAPQKRCESTTTGTEKTGGKLRTDANLGLGLATRTT